MNGRHELSHRVPATLALVEQQAWLAAWRRTYNDERPHKALDQGCPATLYAPSARTYLRSVEGLDYPPDRRLFAAIGDGYIKARGAFVSVRCGDGPSGRACAARQ